MAQALGRVVDRSALDGCGRSRGRHTIEIPAAWVGAEIMVAIPSRVPCARCDGGGCDGCDRRGGYRIEGDASARSLRVRLPHSMDTAVVLRLVRPFGDSDGAISQLHLETRIGRGASAGVVLLCVHARDAAASIAQTCERKRSHRAPWVIAAVALVGIAVLLLAMR